MIPWIGWPIKSALQKAWGNDPSVWCRAGYGITKAAPKVTNPE